MQDYHLRRSITDPLVLSLLVDYQRFAGAPPRSLALVYDRLLQNSLDRGEYGFAPKLRVLAPLAWQMYETGDNLTREQATQLIAGLLFRDGNLDRARDVLDEMVANGVLRFRSDTYVAFMDEAFLHLCVAKHLATLDLEARVGFLLANDERVSAFHAGLFPEVDPLLDALVGPYLEVDAVLRAKQQHLVHVNPYLHRLRRAAFAAQNGAPTRTRVAALETMLFELMEHEVDLVQREAKIALGSFTTAAIRSWVLLGLDSGVPYDDRLTHFTAAASEDVYVAPLERWLARLATDSDPRHDHRFEWSSIQDINGNVVRVEKGKATGKTQRAIYEALTTLAQVGTPYSLDRVRAYAMRAADPRFSEPVWLGIRRHAVKLLLKHGSPEHVTAILAEVEKSPAQWNSVLMELAMRNDEAIAAALVRIILKPEDYDAKKVAYKRTAAAGLAIMDEYYAVRAIETALEAQPSADASDHLPYLALSLGYRGDVIHIDEVAGLATTVASSRLAGYDRDRRAAHYTGTIGRALASFGTRDAFEHFDVLYQDTAWREVDATMFAYLSSFPVAEAVELTKRQLLCDEQDERTEVAILRQLGWFGTDDARDVLDELMRVVDGAGDITTIAAWCGDDAGTATAKLERWRRDWLSSFVSAVGIHADDADLPRFARWVAHDDPSVRRKALDVLAKMKSPGAGHAVAASLVAYPDNHRDALYTLGQQGVDSNEDLVFPYLDDEATRWNATLAMRRVGGARTLLHIYPWQRTKKQSSTTKEAVFYIAERTIGDGVPHDQIMAAVRQLAGAR
jgi:hypothetical protein